MLRPFVARQYKAVRLDSQLTILVRCGMRQTVGWLMQLAALTFLPLVILFQLNFGLPLLVMPISILIGIVVFVIGTKLRGS